jgi:hypothetical protein
MKQFANPSAQGDVYLRVIPELPQGMTEHPPVGHSFHINHGTQAKDHVLTAKDGIKFFTNPDNPVKAYVTIDENVEGDVVLQHLRAIDQHDAIALPKGVVIEVSRQRESTPEGWRMVDD